MSRIRRNWTAKEDALLRSSVQKELDNKRPLLWRELAKHIPGRSNKDCRKRWWNSLAGSTSKGAWTPEEDRQLIEAVEKYGTNWTKVAAAVGTRCGDQCSGHWRHVLNPNINYCDWTPEEDEQLLDAVRVYGTNWATIASFHTPQRTTLALKNQYWKLRQRNQNTTKTTTTRSSTRTSSPTMMGIQPPTGTNKTGDGSCSSDDEADGEECDAEEAVEMHLHGDESETEAQILAMSPQHNVTDAQAVSTPWINQWTVSESSTSQTGVISNKNATSLAPLWAEYQHKTHSATKDFIGCDVGAESWVNGLGDLDMSGDGITTPLYAKDNILQTVDPESDGQAYSDRSVDGFEGQTSHADTGGKLYLTDLDDIFQQCCPITTPTMAQHGTATAPTAIFPSSMNMLTPRPSFDAGGKEMNTIIVPPSDSQFPANSEDKSPMSRVAVEMPSHSVSMSFSCTTAQLGNIMSLFASTGLPVNMKIDTE